jgi:murein DD-endopeptidase MepM/ murein hydrolase activator NlpD
VKSYSGGIRHDYKDSAESPRAFNPRGLSWFAVGLFLPLVAVALLLVSEPNESMVPADAAQSMAMAQSQAQLQPQSPLKPQLQPRTQPLEIAFLPASGERVALALPSMPSPTESILPRPGDVERNQLLAKGELLTLEIKRNDSLDSLFRRNDLSISDLAAMVKLPEAGRELARIHVGDEIEIIRDGSRVLSLRKELSESEELWIRQDGEGFTAETVDLAIEIRTAGAHGTIESSLWNAATDAGLDFGIIEEIAGIFEWDIDFQLEVRTGDSFTVVYEELWRDGVKLRNGQIVAAEFINRGKVHRAARYIDANGDVGHFTPEGLSVRRAFLRNPIEFNSRVSSNFNPNRRHPILNTIRAHRGVDLAAPTGTPIRAAGDGKIIAASVNGSFGNRVEIQHGGNITTLYAHLSGYGKFHVGDRVKQGDIIGYVGMTGSATGPHLHYEYRLNGVHQNPRTVDLPEAEPIAKEYLADFDAASAPLWRQLDLYQGVLFASGSD